jgi:DDE superfamily endonuclease
MSFVSSFIVFLQPLAVAMTAPSFENFLTLVTGWTFASRRTVTGMIVAAQAVQKRHYSSFHRLFASAEWSLDTLGLAVFRLIEPWLVHEGQILLGMDDTLARKRGRKMFGVGMHHDPMLSSRGKAITNWGHSWVVLGVILRFPLWPQRAFFLPVLFRLYLNKQSAAKWRRVYRTRPELAVQMLWVLCRHRQNRRFHAIADSLYGGQSVLNQLPDNCDLTSRLKLDARLYEAPPIQPGRKGRPRKRGARLPNPEQMLAQRARRLSLKIYGRQDTSRVCDTVAYLFAAPQRALRIVAVEPLTGGRPRQAFYSTCVSASVEQVLTWYALRWSVEVTFHDAKTHLGFEQPQGWSRRAAERTAPTAMLLYSLIVLWFAQEGHLKYRAPYRPWYPAKSQPSFADMLATLRRESVREQFYVWGLSGCGSKKALNALETIVSLAA